MPVDIRAAAAGDAAEIERLYLQSAAYLRALGDDTDFQFNAAIYLRDGFGAHPAFAGIVAVQGQRMAGYLLYTFGYDTDRAMRYLFVIDLLVDEALRGQGVGRALMDRAAEVCREHGGAELAWAVYRANQPAYEFYTRLGAQEVMQLRYMTLPVAPTGLEMSDER
jgi:ribosomal protein S18 acetylase RimI-like enzyme